MSTFPKIVMAALVVATGTVAALQMAHIRAGLVTSAGADVLCPALLYIVTRRDQTLLRRVLPLHLGPDQAAALNLIACYAWEFCQRYDLRGTPLFFTHGTFDPMDLLAYTVGVAAVYLPDRLIHRPAVEEFFRPPKHTPRIPASRVWGRK
jgi:hypothetical protein